jgi:hypothetical protein
VAIANAVSRSSGSVWHAAHGEYQLGDCLAKRSAKRWFICTGSLGKTTESVVTLSRQLLARPVRHVVITRPDKLQRPLKATAELCRERAVRRMTS